MMPPQLASLGALIELTRWLRSPEHGATASAIIAAPSMLAAAQRVLADIDADHGDRSVEFLRHGVLLVFGAPGQRNLLAGREHGRTIPLPVLSWGEIPHRSEPLT
jgi:hypothetical protein